MAVSERDRDVMRRIGVQKTKSHAAVYAKHLSLTLPERLRRSWNLFVGGRNFASTAARTDDPTSFYERARTLGLYKRRS